MNGSEAQGDLVLIQTWPMNALIQTWPMNGSEVQGDLVLIQTSPLSLCKSSCSLANSWHLNEKSRARRSVSKQSHLQPRLHSGRPGN